MVGSKERVEAGSGWKSRELAEGRGKRRQGQVGGSGNVGVKLEGGELGWSVVEAQQGARVRLSLERKKGMRGLGRLRK